MSSQDAERDGGLIGPYRKLRELGSGGQGIVYLAEDTRLRRRVALKILHGVGVIDRASLDRFRREAEAASRLDHSGICPVFDADLTGQIPYIAMRFVEGESLADKLESSRGKRKDSSQPGGVVLWTDSHTTVLDPRETESSPEGSASMTWAEITRVIHVVEKIARALHAAHEAGVVHRDIKPRNIMITPEGEPVIMDFGLAHLEDDLGADLTRTGQLFGTLPYMSPEQLLAKRVSLDARTDVWSLGVTLYECLTLQRPFTATTTEGIFQAILTHDPPDPRKVNTALPRELGIVLAAALEKNRDRRYRTAFDLAEDLRRVRCREPILARPVGPITLGRRWVQRNRVAASTLLTLGLGVAVAAYLLFDVSRAKAGLEEVIRANETLTIDRANALQHAQAQQATAEEREKKGRAQTLAARGGRAFAAGDFGLSVAYNVGSLRLVADPLVALQAYQARIMTAPCRWISPSMAEGMRDFVEVTASGSLVSASSDGGLCVRDRRGREVLRIPGAPPLTPCGDTSYSVTLAPPPPSGAASRAASQPAPHSSPATGAPSAPRDREQVGERSPPLASVWAVHGELVVEGRGQTITVRSAARSDSTSVAPAPVEQVLELPLATLRDRGPPDIPIVVSAIDVLSAPGHRHTIVAGLWNGRIAVFRDGTVDARMGHDHFAPGGVSIVAISPDGESLASSAGTPELLVWEVGPKISAPTRFPHPSAVTAVAFHPRSRLLATGGRDGSISVGDKGSPATMRVIGNHEEGVDTLSFSHDGNLLASASRGTLRVWRFSADECSLEFERQSDSLIPSVTFSGDDREVIAAEASGAGVRRWTTGGKDVWVGHAAYVAALRITQKTVRSVGRDGRVITWDLASGQQMSVERAGHIWGGVWLGEHWARAADSRGVTTVQRGAQTLTEFDGSVLDVSPDGQRMAVFAPESRRTRIRIVDVGWNSPVRESTLIDDVKWQGACARFLGSGRFLAVGGQGSDTPGVVEIYDMDPPSVGKLIDRLNLEWEPVGLVSNGDGSSVAVRYSGSSAIDVFEAEASTGPWKPAIRVAKTSPRRSCMAFVPSGTSCGIQLSVGTCSRPSMRSDGIIAGGSDGTLRLWDLKNGLEVLRLNAGAPVSSIAASEDGRTLASGQKDGTVRVWDTELRHRHLEVEALELAAPVTAFGMSSDGLFVATARRSPEGSCRVSVWDAATGRLERHIDSIAKDDVVTAIGVGPEAKPILIATSRSGVYLSEYLGDPATRLAPDLLDVRTAVIDPGGNRAVLAGTVWIYTLDLRSKRLSRQVHGDCGRQPSIAFGYDRAEIISISPRRGLLEAWEAETSRRLSWTACDFEAAIVAGTVNQTSGLIEVAGVPRGFGQRASCCSGRALNPFLDFPPSNVVVARMGIADGNSVMRPATLSDIIIFDGEPDWHRAWFEQSICADRSSCTRLRDVLDAWDADSELRVDSSGNWVLHPLAGKAYRGSPYEGYCIANPIAAPERETTVAGGLSGYQQPEPEDIPSIR